MTAEIELDFFYAVHFTSFDRGSNAGTDRLGTCNGINRCACGCKSRRKEGPAVPFVPQPANVMAAVPLLEAQPAKYLVVATTAYKTGKRSDPVMQTNVAALSARDINDIASYFASRPPITGAYPFDAQKAAAGEKRVSDLKCATCHGATFSGEDLVPRLAGQAPSYLINQLEAFAASRRTHPRAEMPSNDPGDIESIAHYLTTLK